MALPYYPKYPRDFIDGTAMMRLELKGAYSILLDIIYLQDGGCPDNDRYISGLLGCSVRKWNSLKNELITLGKIKCDNGIISNFRADNLLESSLKYQDKQRQNRLNPNKNKNLKSPKVHQSETESKTYKIKNKKTEEFIDLEADSEWLNFQHILKRHASEGEIVAWAGPRAIKEIDFDLKTLFVQSGIWFQKLNGGETIAVALRILGWKVRLVGEDNVIDFKMAK